MAVDFVLQFPCNVRKNMPEEKLVTLVNYMSVAEFAVAQIRKSDPALSLETILGKYTVEISRKGPDGTAKQVPVTIGELVALTEPLRQYKDECRKCRANIADRPFGCMAKINYPITKEAEEWLLSRLPDDAKAPGLALLFKYLADLGIDGAHIDSLRGRSRLFEMKAPAVRRWGGFLGKKQITSSQIIHMLAFGGHIGAQQAALYTRLLGLESCLSDPHPPSANIEQFKTLMCALVMAGRLNAGMAVDA